MIIISKKVGRLANRILLFSHFIGAALEHGFTIANPAFLHYAHYFPSTDRDFLCRFPAADPATKLGFYGRSLTFRAAQTTANMLHFLQGLGFNTGVIRLERSQSLDLDSQEFLDYLHSHRRVFVQDWFFRSSVDCEKHGDAIRSFFTPWDHHLERARAMVEPARQNGKLVVGIHIRQDDYASFKGGQFFYSHQQFRQIMMQIQSNIVDRPVSFLLCSDAPVPRDVFSGMDVCFGNGHALEDLYALAACDLLAGPPSTYSRWASFYGKVPLYVIRDPDLPLAPEHFQVANTLNHDGPPLGLVEWRAPRA